MSSWIVLLSKHAANAATKQSPFTKAIVCPGCSRSLTTTASLTAGHNKWSKTKHIKVVTDKKKMSERTAFTKLIAMYSRMYGDDVKFNPQLANAIAAATKASVPKALVEAAIARGQGRSTTGAQLDSMTFEALMPPNIALIADVETDNKIRTLHDLKYVVKKAGGLSSATAFYFSRRGRAVFRAKEGGPSFSDLLEEAIEQDGADDVEEGSAGKLIVWTEPTMLMAITEAFSKKFELDVMESDIVWSANTDTSIESDSPTAADNLENLLAGLRAYPEVKAIYANIRQGTLTDEQWDKVERHLDV